MSIRLVATCDRCHKQVQSELFRLTIAAVTWSDMAVTEGEHKDTRDVCRDCLDSLSLREGLPYAEERRS